MRKSCSRPVVVLILILCHLGLLAEACGIKAPPRPPRRANLPAVKDLDAVVFETGVQLTWSIPFAAEGVDSFELYRSKPETTAEPCPACPRKYERFRTVQVSLGQTYFQTFDRNIETEGRFYYRVIPLDGRHNRGPDSNEAEVIIKWRAEPGTQ